MKIQVRVIRSVVIYFTSILTSFLVVPSTHAEDFAFSNGKVINSRYFKDPEKTQSIFEDRIKELSPRVYMKRAYADELEFEDLLTVSRGMQVKRIHKERLEEKGTIRDFYFSGNETFSGLFMEFNYEEMDWRTIFDSLYLIYDQDDTTASVPNIDKVNDADSIDEYISRTAGLIVNRAKRLETSFYHNAEPDFSKLPDKEKVKRVEACYEFSAWDTDTNSGIRRIIQGISKNCLDFSIAVFNDGEMLFIPENIHLREARTRYKSIRFRSLLKIGDNYYVAVSWNAPETGYRGKSVYRINNKTFVEVFSDSSWST